MEEKSLDSTYKNHYGDSSVTLGDSELLAVSLSCANNSDPVLKPVFLTLMKVVYRDPLLLHSVVAAIQSSPEKYLSPAKRRRCAG